MPKLTVEITELKAEQGALLSEIYQGLGAPNGEEYLKSSAYQEKIEKYDALVIAIESAWQREHGDGPVPCYVSDNDLFSLYSDLYKDHHGFRYRGDDCREVVKMRYDALCKEPFSDDPDVDGDAISCPI